MLVCAVYTKRKSSIWDSHSFVRIKNCQIYSLVAIERFSFFKINLSRFECPVFFLTDSQVISACEQVICVTFKMSPVFQGSDKAVVCIDCTELYKAFYFTAFQLTYLQVFMRTFLILDLIKSLCSPRSLLRIFGRMCCIKKYWQVATGFSTKLVFSNRLCFFYLLVAAFFIL